MFLPLQAPLAFFEGSFDENCYVGLSDGDDDETDDSYVGLSDGTEEDGTEQDGTDQDHEMDGVFALYTAEQHEDIEMHENLDHGTIYPVPHMSEWVIPYEIRALKVLPPVYEKKKGPTQKERFPSAGESRGRRRGRGRGRSMGRGRRGGRLYEYFECASTSATTE
ncbi:hypothetical protein F2Q69_00011404 [Brassica cretica]|uniref:Uncharacterized protein n=1 Tax=Brassica cretica TaxID=69181 RepID=A0A8S9QNL7_BRACR|nr:hypothetical protein F2Q69_00011404 [Brassica cretica]